MWQGSFDGSWAHDPSPGACTAVADAPINSDGITAAGSARNLTQVDVEFYVADDCGGDLVAEVRALDQVEFHGGVARSYRSVG